MNDTVTKLMELADEYADARFEHGFSRSKNLCDADAKRQAMKDELTRLFTPLTDEQVAELRAEANRGCWIEADHYRKAFRDAEQAHGITGEKK